MGSGETESEEAESMRQQAMWESASQAADFFVARATETINSQFGHGYAKANPSLLAAVMQCAASNYTTAVWRMAVEDMRVAVQDHAAAVRGARNNQV